MIFENKVLACVDQSRFADDVTDYAAWAAQHMDAPLELLHVIDRHLEQGSGKDHSGAIGFDAQEHLLVELSEADKALTLTAREQGRVFLNRLRQRALTAGAQVVDVRQRHGELEDTIAEQESGVRLLVLGRRGESAQTTQRDLGRNVERIVRTVHQPILAVTERFKAPERVLFAFDGSALTRRGVEMVAGSPLLVGLPMHVLMCGAQSKEAAKQLDWAQATLEKVGFVVQVALQPGDPERVIANAVHTRGIDLLIMGAYSHSPLRKLLMGSKTADLLRSAKVPTLLLR
ncbi:MAG: universal stress protein [Rhodoferax sp.]|nr:universal stress protein [Rhodoferax sp.]PIW08456.1 MAG: universal stress protein [Comamonadaceae bacterium CG17_big_fil_post_rev_8_21_14_2_50_60_13]